MIKRTIKYTDFNNEKREDDFMFNLSERDLIFLDSQYDNGMESIIQKFVDEKSNKGILELFETLIRLSYGVKSEDGRSFVKSEELSEAFMQTAAYHELFMSLLKDEKAAVNFFNSLIPKGLRKKTATATQENVTRS